jgi:hypothetical protein
MLLILTIITIAAATLSLLAFLAVLRLPKAVMNVVQQVNAERTAERQRAVAVECIYRDYLGYSNVMALITTPMEVGTAKEQTLASVRKVVGGAHLDYYYTNIRRAINFAATAQYALREKRPDELGDYHERGWPTGTHSSNTHAMPLITTAVSRSSALPECRRSFGKK